MEPLTELMEIIADMVEPVLNKTLSLDALPDKGGLYAEISAGYVDAEYYDRKAIHVTPVLFISKGMNQLDCLTDLSTICKELTSRKSYPQGNTYSFVNAELATEPNKIGKQEDGQYLYSCIINIRCYY